MGKLLGVLFIIAAVIVGIFGGFYFLITGCWDILTNFETLTFWQFVGDVFLICVRDIVAIFIAGVLGIIGTMLMK
jgi:hypothetical protein